MYRQLSPHQQLGGFLAVSPPPRVAAAAAADELLLSYAGAAIEYPLIRVAGKPAVTVLLVHHVGSPRSAAKALVLQTGLSLNLPMP